MLNHDWNVSPKDAVHIQNELRERVRIEPLAKPLRTIAGADVSLNLYGKDAYAGVVVFSYPGLEYVTHAVVKTRIDFPYIPGLLSFREVPALLECLAKLESEHGIVPDLVMVDGQGITHPRRIGIASHLGVLTGIPTLGCAKSPLYGSYSAPGAPGAETPVIDPKTREILGYAYLAKARTNPLIVSPGHLTDPEDALKITKFCLKAHKLPEPTRQAHELVNAFRRGEIKE